MSLLAHDEYELGPTGVLELYPFGFCRRFARGLLDMALSRTDSTVHKIYNFPPQETCHPLQSDQDVCRHMGVEYQRVKSRQ